jgi:hypothetical protein
LTEPLQPHLSAADVVALLEKSHRRQRFLCPIMKTLGLIIARGAAHAGLVPRERCDPVAGEMLPKCPAVMAGAIHRSRPL